MKIRLLLSVPASPANHTLPKRSYSAFKEQPFSCKRIRWVFIALGFFSGCQWLCLVEMKA